MSKSASSPAKDPVRPSSAYLAAQYAPQPGKAVSPRIEEMLMMWPLRRALWATQQRANSATTDGTPATETPARASLDASNPTDSA